MSTRREPRGSTVLVDGLSENEVGELKVLIRDSIRRQHRSINSLRAKFGAQADITPQTERLALLESAYRKMGGNPARISNVHLTQGETTP